MVLRGVVSASTVWLVGVTERGERVLLRWRTGLTSIYPRSLFPPALLDEVQAGAAGASSP